ncbi:fibronectin type III-like domain-contianing protein [Fusicatenibacter sp.]
MVSDEVVQIYGIAPVSRVKKPLKQLLAFRREKAVQPGETRRMQFSIPMCGFLFKGYLIRHLH